ncbi:DUF4265 domain-containing protein [Streptomyces sp. NPDC007126]|uniref:DUF4265 domain-containing protein n=1 Tax=Streptomyces sp. NPDC007126 TaxID=3364774 RepID=UPI0036D01A1E
MAAARQQSDTPAAQTDPWAAPGRRADAVTNISDDHVKVHFRMDIDEDGWPSASVESLRAVDLGDDTVRLDITPWFVRGVASDDIIRVEIDDEGIRWAGETVRPAENCTIRLIVLKDGGSAAAGQSVLESFHKLGTTGEGIERFRMVALDVPPGADLPRTESFWNTVRRRAGGIGKEGCVTAAWRSTATD